MNKWVIAMMVLLILFVLVLVAAENARSVRTREGICVPRHHPFTHVWK
jgi:hypothetical protein